MSYPNPNPNRTRTRILTLTLTLNPHPHPNQVSYQHIFFYPLMAFGRINLYAQATRVRGRGKG